jgi:hypothetical protein
MSAVSLQQVMREMVRRVQTQEQTGESRYRSDSGACPLNEIEIYISMDSVLADLYRQYLDALRRQSNLISSNGRHDPMTEVACDAAESAHSAYQTRLLELRRERYIRARVVKRLTESKRAIENYKSKRLDERADRVKNSYIVHRSSLEKNKKLEENIFFLYMAMLFMRQALKLTCNNLSMMYSFSNASYCYRAQNRSSA